ncbi:hypothetical protein vBEcoMWL3_gp232 [Escherichia phage vB_EcoM_WL-3]|nr:hypothetical protein vBEcoMWL3_gp232 [Escherichia phage vB_EcoM_WL-3]
MDQVHHYDILNLLLGFRNFHPRLFCLELMNRVELIVNH